MKKHPFKEWLLATRPWSFPASAMPVIATIAYLYWFSSFQSLSIQWLNGAFAIVGILIFHAAGNVLSDYYDYQRGVDTPDVCGVKPLVCGRFTPREFKVYGYLLFASAVIFGLLLWMLSGWWLLLIGFLGALFTVAYAFFKYRALGDVVIFIVYGLLPVLGTSYVMTGTFVYPALVLSLPIGLITVAILHSNNTRDIQSDGKAGIRTFAMLVGAKTAVRCYQVEVLLPCLLVAVAAVLGWLPLWSLLVWIAFPFAWSNSLQANRLGVEGNIAIASLDEKTAQLQMVFSLLFSVSFCLAVWI